MKTIKELYRYRDLLWLWTLREIGIRYKQSILGGAWAILQPLALMLIFTVIFGYFVKVPTDGVPYPIFSYSALLPWTFFSTSISFAVPSLVNNMNLVSKVYFPREILPFASVGAAFVDYLVALVIFLLLIFIYRIQIYMSLFMWPVLLTIQVLLTLGIGLLASAMTVRYRDIRFVVPLALQLLMYLAPVVYPLSVVPSNYRFIYLLNPMAVLIDGYRRITIDGQLPDGTNLLIAAGISLAIFILGYRYFKKAEVSFADII